MQNQDKTLTIYKSFTKDKLLSEKETKNSQVDKCRKIFNELVLHSDTYCKELLAQLKINITAMVMKLECDLIDYTMDFVEREKE